jgi:AP-1 complex subunit beta-1
MTRLTAKAMQYPVHFTNFNELKILFQVIASMTVGKDVSALFPDVANCMQTDNLELKKLVYLYLMNYAKSQPDMAIMAVNTFVKDCEDPNPLIR